MNELRRNGKTTRIVDQCIQDFFTKGGFIAEDPNPQGENMNARSKQLYRLVKKRLASEHGIKISMKAPYQDARGVWIYTKEPSKQ